MFVCLQAWSIDFWLNVAGVPREKLILGVATYGMTYTLATAAQHGLKAAATGAGDPGKYTQESGILAYYEVRHTPTIILMFGINAPISLIPWPTIITPASSK